MLPKSNKYGNIIRKRINDFFIHDKKLYSAGVQDLSCIWQIKVCTPMIIYTFFLYRVMIYSPNVANKSI